MKDIYVIPAIPLVVLYDVSSGAYDAIQLTSADAVRALIRDLEKAELVLSRRPVLLRIVEPEPS